MLNATKNLIWNFVSTKMFNGNFLGAPLRIAKGPCKIYVQNMGLRGTSRGLRGSLSGLRGDFMLQD